MHKPIFLLVFPIILLGFNAGFSEIYNLEIDEHVFDLEYEIDADVLAMALDQELNSLLIGIDNSHDSLFSIKLPDKMISAENNEFAVLVNGLEVDYEYASLDDSIQITFFVPTGTQEIEIIGTYVIPEFSYVVLILILMMTSVIIFTKRNILGIK